VGDIPFSCVFGAEMIGFYLLPLLCICIGICGGVVDARTEFEFNFFIERLINL